ncbi:MULTISPECIES: S-Ena type endospore appendage [Bacillus cereus group]|uniref:S-Ena type endospore appendage n=1 Tax=Bacillus cereus group TaxID=86661 RepID=UPI0013D09B02|nr:MULTISPECIES: S-Ena type endospore appendage [Bacillus cereus group]MDX5921130.1 S-Ena type endospore appendage [Bacillus cereus group sp. BfR-BA-01033]MDX5973502.1 S-Ena type endospore appendage [Bacillus cereus group sp. BfR-BA-00287]
MGNCSTNLSCCANGQKTIVQDKVCIDWTAAATAAIIYASGYLKVDTGTGPVTIVFYSGGVTGTAVETIVVATGSSASFTVRRFDTVTILGTAAAETGEFCMTIRYTLS